MTENEKILEDRVKAGIEDSVELDNNLDTAKIIRELAEAEKIRSEIAVNKKTATIDLISKIGGLILGTVTAGASVIFTAVSLHSGTKDIYLSGIFKETFRDGINAMKGFFKK